MRALFDVNALIALVDENHVFHQTIRQWWTANLAYGWASCPITENGFLRVMAQPGYPNQISLPDAFRLLDLATAQSSHSFWPDSLSLTDTGVIDRRYVIGPRQLTGAYLLALAVRNGGRLVTFDRAISLAEVHNAEPQHLVIL